jgi:hypothetical protein
MRFRVEGREELKVKLPGEVKELNKGDRGTAGGMGGKVREAGEVGEEVGGEVAG